MSQTTTEYHTTISISFLLTHLLVGSANLGWAQLNSGQLYVSVILFGPAAPEPLSFPREREEYKRPSQTISSFQASAFVAKASHMVTPSTPRGGEVYSPHRGGVGGKASVSHRPAFPKLD